MAKKKLKCPKCDRTFSMKAHLARHVSATHSRKKRKAKVRTKRAKRGRAARIGRPKGIASRLGLRSMTLEQLGALITAARAEARRRLAAIQKAMK